jgi:uncharacterized RDD family membrane protein YckC
MTEDNKNVYAPTAVRIDDVHPEGELAPATRMSRLVAMFIDGFVVGTPAFLLAYVWIARLLGIDAFEEIGFLDDLLISTIYFAIYFALFMILNWMWLERSGQSLGKKVMHIRIVRTDGSQVGARRALFIRALPLQGISMLPIVGLLVAVVDGILIFRESRKCLHDDIADTIVIKA